MIQHGFCLDGVCNMRQQRFAHLPVQRFRVRLVLGEVKKHGRLPRPGNHRPRASRGQPMRESAQLRLVQRRHARHRLEARGPTSQPQAACEAVPPLRSRYPRWHGRARKKARTNGVLAVGFEEFGPAGFCAVLVSAYGRLAWPHTKVHFAIDAARVIERRRQRFRTSPDLEQSQRALLYRSTASRLGNGPYAGMRWCGRRLRTERRGNRHGE